MFDAPPDIPLSLGDLVGRSFRTFRNQIYLFASVLFWPTVWSTLSIAGMRWCFIHWAGLHSLSYEAFLAHSAAFFACLSALTLAQWEESIRSVALVRLVLGSDPTYALSYKYAKRRKWAAFLIYNAAVLVPVVVMIFWGGLAALFIYISRGKAILAMISPIFFFVDGLAMTLTVCWALLFSALGFSVLSCEDVKLGAVWRRTYDFSMRYLWRGGSYMVLLGITLFAVTLAIDLPLMVVSLLDAWSHGFSAERVTNMPVYLQVMGGIWDSVINIFLLGVALIADGFYYNDLRLRLEGRDLLGRLAKLPSLGG